MAIAFRAATSTTTTILAGSITINKPTGTVDGDVMLALIDIGDNTVTITAPSGWVSEQSQTFAGPFRKAQVFKKVAASEGASYVFSFSSNVSCAAAILSYSGVDNTTSVDASSKKSNASSTSVTATGVTTTTANTMLVMFGCIDTLGTWTNPSGFTKRADQAEISLTLFTLGAFDKAQAAVGATGNVVATFSPGERSAGFLVALRAAATGSLYYVSNLSGIQGSGRTYVNPLG